jgi:GntR family transcriptional regulator
MTGRVRHEDAGSKPAPLPRYHQIYVLLREKIASGEYPPGSLIRSEQELSSDFSVSRITVRRALDELSREGLLTRHRGRGTFVAEERATHRFTASVDEQMSNALRLGRKTRVELLAYDFVSAPAQVARVLGMRAQEPLHKTVRVRYFSGEPLSHVTAYAPPRIAELYDQAMLRSSKPIITMIRDSGMHIAAAEQVITARLADSIVAPALHLEIGSPLLKISRSYSNDKGEGLLHIDALYRSDRYSLRVTLTSEGVTDNGFLTNLL